MKNKETLEKDTLELLMLQINNPRLLEIVEELKGDNSEAAELLKKLILGHLNKES